MLDLLLINSFWGFNKKNIWKEISGTLPPLGLASIAALVREKGFGVKIIDMQAEKMDLYGLADFLKGISQPRFVGISATTLSINNAYKISSVMKKVFPNTKVVFGGHHPTALSDEVINKNEIDIVVRGEGEITMEELLKGSPLNEIDGIVYKDKNGKIIFNKERKFIEDINILPIPAYDLLPMDKYCPSMGSYKRLPAVSMIVSRGCPGKCAFCYRIFGQKARIKSAKNIYKEIKYLQDNFGIKEVNFYDDTFTTFKENVANLCQIIIQGKADITWSCFSRIGFVDYNLLKLMKRAGCHQIMYGIESADEEILKNIKKEISLELAKKSIFLTKKAGINCRGAFMFGSPGETEETIKKTIDFAIKSNLDFASFNIVTPYPGTEIFNWAKENHFLKIFNWDLYDEATPLIELSSIGSRKLTELYHLAYKKFYLRLGYILKHFLKIRSFSDLKYLLKGFFSLVNFLFAK